MESDHKLACFSIPATFWPHIGEDLWLEIFKRSPIETLCRFQSICKSWKSAISSPFFINLHHSFTSSSIRPNLKPYFLITFRGFANSYDLHRPQNPNLKHQIHRPFRLPDFVDLIHGVFCVSYSLTSYFDSIILWNPAIHKYLALPRIPFHLESSMSDFPDVKNFKFLARFSSHAIGFGRTSKNDFKVVRIWIPWYTFQSDFAKSRKPLPPASCEVFSTQEGIWRVTTPNIDHRSFGFDDGSSRTSCFVNGTIHWVITRLNHPEDSRQFVVLMFDCECEEFRVMDLPKELYQDHLNRPHNADVLEYCGMLSVVVSRGSENGYVELWMMEEHGVSSTWNKVYGFDLNGFAFGFNLPLFEELAPYGPRQWDEFDNSFNRFYNILGGHVYEESMFLMDDIKARSYGEEEIVPVDSSFEEIPLNMFLGAMQVSLLGN